MNKNPNNNSFLKWIIVAYCSLVVEKLILTAVIEIFKLTQGVKHMGIGLLIVNVFIVPFVQGTIWQLGGDIAMYCMLGFAMTSYMLGMNGLWKAVAIFLGSLALIFSLLWDFTMLGKSGLDLAIHSASHVVIVVLVSILGSKANALFDKFAGGGGGAA